MAKRLSMFSSKSKMARQKIEQCLQGNLQVVTTSTHLPKNIKKWEKIFMKIAAKEKSIATTNE